MAATRGCHARVGSFLTCAETMQSQNRYGADVTFHLGLSVMWVDGTGGQSSSGVQKSRSPCFWYDSHSNCSEPSNCVGRVTGGFWWNPAWVLLKGHWRRCFFCKTFPFQWIRSFCWKWNVLLKTCCVGKLPTIYVSPTPIEKKWIVSSFCFPFQCINLPMLPLVPTQGPSHEACIC